MLKQLLFFDKTKSGVYLLDKYLLITLFILSADLPQNLSFIDHVSRKQERFLKKFSLLTTILDCDVEDIVKFFKRIYLFLKSLRPPPHIDEVAINVTKVNNKIFELDI